MLQPDTPGTADSETSASGSDSAENASCSRIRIGAVWWLIPRVKIDMHDNRKDKHAILLPGRSEFKLTCSILLSLLIAGCAGSGTERSDEEAAIQGETTAQADVGEADDAMFHHRTAQRLMNVGDYDGALEQFLSAAQASSDPRLAGDAARLALRLKRWEPALSATERWLELAPDTPSARHIRALAQVNAGRFDQAIDTLDGIVVRSDESEEGWRQVALLLAAVERPGDGLVMFDRLAEETSDMPGPGVTAHARSILLWQLDRTEAALADARQAGDESGRSEHLGWAAQLAAGSEDLELALSLYRQARGTEAENVGLALAEAEVLRQLDRTDEAIEVLRRLPPDSDSLYTLGIYLVQEESTEEAEKLWLRLAALPKGDDAPEHAFLVGHLAELIDRPEDALTWYRRAEDGPRRQQALLRQAFLEGSRGQLDRARDVLAVLRAEADPEIRLDTWLIEAELLREAGQAEAAIAVLHQPLREASDDIDLLYARALSAAAAGDIDLAEQDLRRIIQLDGTNAMALNALGYTLTDQTDRHDEAYRLIQRALELDPDDPATLDSMGWVLFRLGRPEAALDYLQRALDGDDNGEIAAHLIAVLWHLDRRDEARAVAEAAMERHAGHVYLEETLTRLGLLQ